MKNSRCFISNPLPCFTFSYLLRPSLSTQAAFDITARQGFQPSVNKEQRKARQIEGLTPLWILRFLPPETAYLSIHMDRL